MDEEAQDYVKRVIGQVYQTNGLPATLKRSSSVDKIMPALVAAKKKIKNVIKNKDNEFTSSRYADLNAHLDAVSGPLLEHDIIPLQSFGSRSTTADCMEIVVITTFIHISGQFFECALPIPIKKNTAQEIGSACTYGRRYTLSALAGTYQEDDDGNSASGREKLQNDDSAGTGARSHSGKRPPSKAVGGGKTIKQPKAKTEKTAGEGGEAVDTPDKAAEEWKKMDPGAKETAENGEETISASRLELLKKNFSKLSEAAQEQFLDEFLPTSRNLAALPNSLYVRASKAISKAEQAGTK